MRTLFDQVPIQDMLVPNRFVRSATYEGMGHPDGSCKDAVIELTADLARGEVGLIISSHAYVELRGRVRPPQLGVHSDEMVPGLARMARAAHENGSRIVLQIAHAGCTAVEPVGEFVGPSAITLPDGHSCRELTLQDITDIVKAFRLGAQRAKQAGFDGVQIHSAHAYLLSQFLSPYFNRRSDQYGGSLVNRSRIHREVLREVRDVFAGDAPILIKMNSDDFIDGGFTRKEMVQVAKMLADEGISAVEISGGTPLSPADRGFARPGIQPPEDEVYYLDAARLYKDEVSVPLILVGGIRTFDVARQLVEQEIADFISLSRPLIREPRLVRRWHEGDTSQAACIHCNLCFGPARSGEGIYCVPEHTKAEKHTNS